MKFKKGDKLTPILSGHGFENATVMGTVRKNGKRYYTLKILCGTATIPVSAEVNYKLNTEDKK